MKKVFTQTWTYQVNSSKKFTQQIGLISKPFVKQGFFKNLKNNKHKLRLVLFPHVSSKSGKYTLKWVILFFRTIFQKVSKLSKNLAGYSLLLIPITVTNDPLCTGPQTPISAIDEIEFKTPQKAHNIDFFNSLGHLCIIARQRSRPKTWYKPQYTYQTLKITKRLSERCNWISEHNNVRISAQHYKDDISGNSKFWIESINLVARVKNGKIGERTYRVT